MALNWKQGKGFLLGNDQILWESEPPAATSFCLDAALSSSCRLSWTTVYSSVILVLACPAIFDASILEPPTSCRQVMLARRSE